MLMRMGASIRRAGWSESDSFVMDDGLMITKIGRKRVHSIPVGDILAMDWTVAISPE